MPFTKYMKTLREKGLKVTQQRLEILKFLDENRTHPTLDEVYIYMIKKFPSISKMTVYNVIDSMTVNGIINSVRFVNSTELRVDYDRDIHFHFLCKKCRMIYDVAADFDVTKEMKSTGHKVDDYKVNIYGVCKKCLKKK